MKKIFILSFSFVFLLFSFCKLIFEIEDSGDPYGIYFSFGGNIFKMNYDGSSIRPLTFDKEDNNNPQVASDGSLLIYETQYKSNVFSSNMYDYSEIDVMNFENQNVDRIVDTYNFCLRPSLSSDNRHLTFCSYSSSGKKIAMSDIRGGNLVYITDYGRYDYPIFMADRDHILYQYDDDLTTNLYVINIHDKTVQQLTDTNWNINAVLSPDGSQIAWESYSDINIMNADGSNSMNLTNNQYIFSRTPSFSHCGGKLVFIIERTYNDSDMQNEIHMINLKTKKTKLILKKGYNFYPKFFSDDGKILFSQYEDSQFYICVIDTNGNGYQRLCRGSDPCIY